MTEAGFETGPGPAGTRFTEIRRFATIDSTNRYLLDVARNGAPEGLVARADHQSAGRGRLGRRWEAAPGTNLLASFLLRPPLVLDEYHLCTAAVALAAVTACIGAAGLEPSIKWPNDLLVGERKLAGILAETVSGGAAPEHPALVVGLGLNVLWPEPTPSSETPSGGREPPGPGSGSVPGVEEDTGGIGRTATSLWRETGRRPEPGTVLELLLRDLEPRLAALEDRRGRDRLCSEYRRRCATIGQAVRRGHDRGDDRRHRRRHHRRRAPGRRRRPWSRHGERGRRGARGGPGRRTPLSRCGGARSGSRRPRTCSGPTKSTRGRR